MKIYLSFMHSENPQKVADELYKIKKKKTVETVFQAVQFRGFWPVT